MNGTPIPAMVIRPDDCSAGRRLPAALKIGLLHRRLPRRARDRDKSACGCRRSAPRLLRNLGRRVCDPSSSPAVVSLLAFPGCVRFGLCDTYSSASSGFPSTSNRDGQLIGHHHRQLDECGLRLQIGVPGSTGRLPQSAHPCSHPYDRIWVIRIEMVTSTSSASAQYLHNTEHRVDRV